LWNEDTEKDSVDCDSLKLATKVGILGVIFAIVLDFIYTYVMIIYVTSTYNISFYMIFINLSAFGFVGAVFTSVGFVSIFSMKQYKRGFIFPLIVIFMRLYNFLYLRLSYELGVYSLEFHTTSIQIAGYLATIIGGLLLLSIRSKSKNSQYLTIFSIIYILQDFLSDAIWWIIFRGPVQVNTVLDYIITSLPNLLTGFAVSALIIMFFILERRQGCLKMDESQETPILE
jgi:hypothetical protein